jgi:hypothetical protein
VELYRIDRAIAPGDCAHCLKGTVLSEGASVCTGLVAGERWDIIKKLQVDRCVPKKSVIAQTIIFDSLGRETRLRHTLVIAWWE